MSKEIDWVIGGDTGLSSLTIWGVMMGAKVSTKNLWRVQPPFDAADFGRCHRLLKLMPEWRERLHEVSDQLPEWKPYVDAWGKLTDLFVKAARTGNYGPLFDRLDRLKDKSGTIQYRDSQIKAIKSALAKGPVDAPPLSGRERSTLD